MPSLGGNVFCAGEALPQGPMTRKQVSERGDPPFLAVARQAASGCGVSRLADITGLDRIGLPVWQAIRPTSRAISVHQGKALTDSGARIGALCEAIESHWAEQVAADGPFCRLSDLAGGAGCPCHGDDLLVDRNRPPDWSAPIHWSTSIDLSSGATIHLPHAFISLDFRGGFPSRIERSSNGLGAGPDQRAALITALFELIERDALAAWSRKRTLSRMAARVDPGSIPFAWFQDWRERLRALGAKLEIHALDSVTGAPAFRCAIRADQAFGAGQRVTVGSAAHAVAETALLKAFAEAAQTRLTWIAAARDDIYPRHFGFVEAAEVDDADDEDDEDDEDDVPGRAWRDPEEPAGDPLTGTIDRLAAAGYRQVLVKRLDPGRDGVAVVKAFVPGLALLVRSRRVPA